MGEGNVSDSVFAIVVAAFVLLLIGVRSCSNYFESSRRAQSRLEPNLPTSLRTQLPPEQQGNRLSIILDSIIFKKVLASNDRDASLLLPHEQEMSSRALEQLECASDVENREHRHCDDADDHGQSDDADSATSDEENQQRNKQQGCKDDIYVNMISSPSLRMSSTSTPIYSPKTCAICLEKYKVNDDICWSKNKKCVHAFHFNCMLGWLMDNDDCPMCREDYLKSTGD